mgnify:CR=1 FL=1
MNYPRIKDIRTKFRGLLVTQNFTKVNRESTMTGLVGNSTIEIINANFIADEPSIFGTVNEDYVKREEEWYDSMSLNVNDIPGGAPAVWKAVADPDGFINSNYGWCIYSKENGDQYQRTLQELLSSPSSRRAIMIYTRPNMWEDYNKNGRSDFMCTNAVQYLIRNGAVHAIVQMRSNDAVFGYRNDWAWQKHVLEKVTNNLNELRPSEKPYFTGHLFWNAGSLHVYARHYYLVDNFSKTGNLGVKKEDYIIQYPDSSYK